MESPELARGQQSKRTLSGVLFATSVPLIAMVVLGYVLNTLYPLHSLFAFTPTPQRHQVAEWATVQRTGVIVGNAHARVFIAEFSDFQCPACAYVHGQLQKLQQRLGDTVAISFHYYPLESVHPYARMAAIAAECANAQGRFHAMYDLLFVEQDSIGVRPWETFASDAGIVDLMSFRRCMSSEKSARRVRSDQVLGQTLGVSATPTLIVQGTMLPPGIPLGDSLMELVLRNSSAPVSKR